MINEKKIGDYIQFTLTFIFYTNWQIIGVKALKNSVKMLETYRDQIDGIDKQIVQLLNQRTVCAIEIGSIKAKQNLPVFVPEREEAVLNKITENNQGPMGNQALRDIYALIIQESRRLQEQSQKFGDGDK